MQRIDLLCYVCCVRCFRYSIFSIIIVVVNITYSLTIMQYQQSHLYCNQLKKQPPLLLLLLSYTDTKIAMGFNLIIQFQFDMLTSFKTNNQMVVAAAVAASVVIRVLVISWRQQYHCFTHTHTQTHTHART